MWCIFLKSAYTKLEAEESTNALANIPIQVLHILQHAWKNKMNQRGVKTFAWRLLKLALDTSKRVHWILPSVDETCSCCDNIEDEKHIFFMSSYAGAIWFGSALGLCSTELPTSRNRAVHQPRKVWSFQ